jgi:hypothetical protein
MCSRYFDEELDVAPCSIKRDCHSFHICMFSHALYYLIACTIRLVEIECTLFHIPILAYGDVKGSSSFSLLKSRMERIE